MRDSSIHSRRNFVAGGAIAGTAALLTAHDAKAWTAPDNSLVVNHYVDSFTGTDTQKIQAAVNAAALNSNGTNLVVFGARTYTITSTITIPANSTSIVRMRGEGFQMRYDGSTVLGTVIKFAPSSSSVTTAFHISNTAGPLVFANGNPNYAPYTYFEIRDLALVYPEPSHAGIGIRIGVTDHQINSLGKPLLDNVGIYNFDVCLQMENIQHLHCERVCVGTRDVNNALGLHIKSVTPAATSGAFFTGALTFVNCEFGGPGREGSCAAYLLADEGRELRGVHFSHCTFHHGERAIRLRAEGGGRLQDLFINSCALDNGANSAYVKTGIHAVASESGSSIAGVNISDTYIVQFRECGILLSGESPASVENINISNNYIGLSSIAAISCWRVFGVAISSNTLFDCAYTAYNHVISLNGGSVGFTVQGNTHRAGNMAAPFRLVTIYDAASTNFVIKDNVGRAAGDVSNASTGTFFVSNNIAY